jgi:hypothetical protein
VRSGGGTGGTGHNEMGQQGRGRGRSDVLTFSSPYGEPSRRVFLPFYRTVYSEPFSEKLLVARIYRRNSSKAFSCEVESTRARQKEFVRTNLLRQTLRE